MADDPTTPPVPATGPSGPPATGHSASAMHAKTIQDLEAKVADLERHLTNKTEEAARHGKSFTSAEKELAEYKEKERLTNEAALSDVQKATNRAQELEALNQQYKQELIMAKVQLAAKSMDFQSADIAAKVIQDLLEYGDDGMPTNVDKALTDLAKNNPFLLKPKDEIPPPETPPAQTAQNFNDQRPPVTSPNNPGRSNTSTPQQLPPGQVVKLNQVKWSR